MIKSFIIFLVCLFNKDSLDEYRLINESLNEELGLFINSIDEDCGLDSNHVLIVSFKQFEGYLGVSVEFFGNDSIPNSHKEFEYLSGQRCIVLFTFEGSNKQFFLEKVGEVFYEVPFENENNEPIEDDSNSSMLFVYFENEIFNKVQFINCK